MQIILLLIVGCEETLEPQDSADMWGGTAYKRCESSNLVLSAEETVSPILNDGFFICPKVTSPTLSRLVRISLVLSQKG